ncbi:hypothetical protein R83H12_02032 [Fibrobacteria bacterium R8-3-H12]
MNKELKDQTRRILSIPNKKAGRYKPNQLVMFKNINGNDDDGIDFSDVLAGKWKINLKNGTQQTFANINDLLNAGWVMDYTQNDLKVLERFRKVAKAKANIEEPDRIFLGYKIESHYVHLYLDDPTPGGKGALGCCGTKNKILEYAPTKIKFKGKTYYQKTPMDFNDPNLDDLIAAVILSI